MKRSILVLLTIFFTVAINATLINAKTLKLSGNNPPNSPTSLAEKNFCDLVEKYTGGEVEVKHYPGGQLGSASSQIESVQTGALDMSVLAGGWAGRVIKEFNAAYMPYVFENFQQFKKFLNSSLFKEWNEKMAKEKNMRMLTPWLRAPRAVFSKKPLFNINDFQGLKMRVWNVPAFVKGFKAMGTNPTRIGWGEVYLALKQGVVDACESTLDNYYPKKFQEVAPYIIDLNFGYGFWTVFVNEAKYQKFSPNLRNAILKASAETADYYAGILETSLKNNIEQCMKEGTVIIKIYQKPFIDKAKTVIMELDGDAWPKGSYEKVRNAVQ
ncbi:TRAP transporter substrate-binding protein [Thermodesulfobacteriota bacterium]